MPLTRSFFLFGPRQTGKSTLINSTFKKDVWKINLLLTDIYFKYSKEPSMFTKEALAIIPEKKIKTVFLDEIQRIPLLLNEVQYLMQEFPDCQFILTGSSARKLKRGGANLLAGRAIERHLYPLTYTEIKEIFNLEDMLRFGSLPPTIDSSPADKQEILSTYVNTYLREEIQQEGIVRNIGGFYRFLDLAASQFSELVSFSSIAREVQLPVKTVQSYYEILEDTLVGFRLSPWRKSLRKRLSAHPKFYFFDTGVTNAVNKHLTGTLDRTLLGRLFESWLIAETRACIHYAHSEANMYFWRTNHKAEVDLLIEKHGKILAAYEIKYSNNISTAHLSGLRAFSSENKDVPCFIISLVDHAFKIGDVRILPWQNFLKHLNNII